MLKFRPPPATFEAVSIARLHHLAGRLDIAAQIYRQVLEVEPLNPDAWQLLGAIAHQCGRHAEAIELIQRAICQLPTVASYHSNLGLALQALGRVDDAILSFRQAVALNPRDPLAYNNLGNALIAIGQFQSGADCFRRALELNPNLPEALSNLGGSLRDLGQLDEAAECCRRAVELRPMFAAAHHNLANTLIALGRFDEALRSAQRAIELKPGDADFHVVLGIALRNLSRLDNAEAAYRRALQLQPRHVTALTNLGNILAECERQDEAADCYRHAVEAAPDNAEALSNLAGVFKDQGRYDEALTACRRALAIRPGLQVAHDNLLCILQYRDGVTLRELYEEHLAFDRVHAVPLASAQPALAVAREPDRRLRIGLISPDLGRHPVGDFLLPVLENLDRQRLEVVGYFDRRLEDDRTPCFRAAADQWRVVAALSDEALAKQVRDDAVDILFDLAGHTANNRLLVFARKPAPVQISWIGYAATTGLSAMDYIIADWHEIPPESERFYRERVLRMPDCWLCFAPPLEAPPVAPLPALRTGAITFGCFNNPAKLTPRVIAVWARLLRRVERSRLILKYGGNTDPTAIERFRDGFRAHGVDADRIDLRGRSPRVDHLATYAEIDIALDPFPFSGGITSCEALWMGVPVVTCPGESFASRHALSFLSTVGLNEAIACSHDDYIERAAALAADVPRLATMRAGLRDRVAASPLCDARRFTSHLESLLRQAWRDWCEQSEPRAAV